MLKQVEWDRKEPAMHLLLRILGNVINEPENPKYRTLRRDNPKVAGQVLSIPGGFEILHAAGFRCHTPGLVLGAGVSVADVAAVRDELQDFAEVEALGQKRRERDARIARAKASEAVVTRFARPARVAQPPALSLQLQTMAQVLNARLSTDATVGELRANAAKQLDCLPLQLSLVLVAADGKATRLLHDDAALEACGATNGCSILVSVGMKDELIGDAEHIRRACPTAAQAVGLQGLAEAESWRFTQEVLQAARAHCLLPAARLRALKRSLHAGELTLKQVRDQVTAEAAPPADGQPCPLQTVAERYLSGSDCFQQRLQRIGQVLDKAEQNRRYAEMIARDNALGLQAH